MKTGEQIKRLAEIQFRFDKKAADEKILLVEKLNKTTFDNCEELIAFHDRLLCIMAFADNQKIFDAAGKALKNLAAKTKTFLETANDTEIWKLTEAAIANTTIRASFSYEMVKWLIENFLNDIEYCSCDASKEAVGYVFKQILPPAVGEAVFDNHERSLEELVKKIAGKETEVLPWVIKQFETSALTDKSKEQLFEQLLIYINWKTNPSSPTTFASVDLGKKFFFNGHDLIHHAEMKKIFADKKLKPVELNISRKKHLCDVAKGVLCAHYREIDPITYSETLDTELYDMGRGITIALYYMRPPWRLSCESYVSYMAFRNGIPVSYGGGWLFFDRTKLAGNVFPAFRGGESAYLFAHLYRLYHLRFGVNCFQVDPYQIGERNNDAITSGAFWFYYRLGFRPNNEKLLQLAAEEAAKRNADKKYRSPANVLRKFTHAEMILSLSPAIHLSHQQGLQKMEERVVKDFGGNFTAYFETCFSELWKICKKHKVKLPENIRCNALAMELCGIISVFCRFSKLSKPDLKKLAAALAQKASGSEAGFIKHFNRITHLKKALYKIS